MHLQFECFRLLDSSYLSHSFCRVYVPLFSCGKLFLFLQHEDSCLSLPYLVHLTIDQSCVDPKSCERPVVQTECMHHRITD